MHWSLLRLPVARFEFWRNEPLEFSAERASRFAVDDSATEIPTMNAQTDDHDQADEEILTRTVSDEALEAAAGSERITNTLDPAGGYC
jgi:hypothetical protein